MTKTYNWTTAHGSKVEMNITVEHVTSETAYADGMNIEVKCDRWTRLINTMLVNGKETAQKELGVYIEGRQNKETKIVRIGRKGKDYLMVAIPEEIADEIYGEEAKADKEKWEKARATEKAYDDHRAMMKKAMGY